MLNDSKFAIYEPSLLTAAERCGFSLPPVSSLNCESEIQGYVVQFIDIINDSTIMLLRNGNDYHSLCMTTTWCHQPWSDEVYSESIIEEAKHIITIYDVDAWLSLSADDYQKLCKAHTAIIEEEKRMMEEKRRQDLLQSIATIEEEIEELRKKHEELSMSYNIMTRQ